MDCQRTGAVGPKFSFARGRIMKNERAQGILHAERKAAEKKRGHSALKLRIKTLVDPEWDEIRPRSTPENTYPDRMPKVFWSYQITLPLPAPWPPTADRKLHYYVYAIGQDVSGGLSDGHFLAAPWARVVGSPEGESSLKLEFFNNKIEPIGIQGVRHLTREEHELYERWPEQKVLTYFADLKAARHTSKPETPDFKKFFCTLIRHNGIYTRLRPRHEGFFRWLKCQ
jgi:hypothetical protein